MCNDKQLKASQTTSEFEKRIAHAAEKFSMQVLNQVYKSEYQIPVAPGVSKKVVVNQGQVEAGLSILTMKTGNSTLIEDTRFHIRRLERLLPFCSSPKSFSSSWNLRSRVLTKELANRLVNEGAQLIPVNEKERIFKIDQQGVQLGPNKRLILGVRHSEGNYDDELDNRGTFTYQPPNNTQGMMRYRWSEHLQHELDVPLVIIVIIWFEYKINESLNQVFVIAPATIINIEQNMLDLTKSLSKPLKLKIIERNEAYDYIQQLNALDQATIDVKVRRALNDELSNEWSYSQINNLNKGNRIKDWAKIKKYSCPGELCNHTTFESSRNSEIAFGHIIPQKWAFIFPHLLGSIHHPDNLYLTCSRCNSQLRDDFPNIKLRNRIVSSDGTLGDWIRQFENEIRSI